MERWMQVHKVTTQAEWEAQQPKPEPDRWDAWHSMCVQEYTVTVEDPPCA